MHRELVDTRRWISERRFLHALNYCMLLPGPEAQQLATYIGWLLHGVRGGLAAGGLFVLPSLALLIALSWLYMRLGADAGRDLALRREARRARDPRARGAADRLAGAEAGLAARGGRGGVRGAARGRAVSARDRGGRGDRLARSRPDPRRGSPRQCVERAARTRADRRRHSDASARALHARRASRRRSRAASALGAGVFAAAAPSRRAAPPLYAEMARFFTQAALLTFGGAYAVLPYIVQGAVESARLAQRGADDGWARARRDHAGAADHGGGVRGLRGRVDARGGRSARGRRARRRVATFFTFLPSFVFIFAGAPWVERTRHDVRLAGPLTGITAAVVGAILSLAVFFAGHVLFPDGIGGRFDFAAAALALAIGVVLYREWLGMVPAILVAVLAGAAYRALT